MNRPNINIFIDAKDISVNTNSLDYSVTIIHLPTGVKAKCNRYKSQHKNRIDAMLILREMLYNLELEKRSSKFNSQMAR